MVPATDARQMRLPSGWRSSSWLGCQVASATRDATEGAKWSTTSVSGWSAMMSQARAKASSMTSGGASKVCGVTSTDKMRSILNVRIAPRASSKPIRYRACVVDDGSMR